MTSILPLTMPEGLDDDSPPPGPWRVAAGPAPRIAHPPERRCKPERTNRLTPALAQEFLDEMRADAADAIGDAVLDRMKREAWPATLRP